jgi:hypothetical protein
LRTVKPAILAASFKDRPSANSNKTRARLANPTDTVVDRCHRSKSARWVGESSTENDRLRPRMAITSVLQRRVIHAWYFAKTQAAGK